MTMGVTSPAVTATIASSSRATPCDTWPRPISASPSPSRAIVARSASACRLAICAASRNAAAAASKFPASCSPRAGGTSRYPCTSESGPTSSACRAARASQPPPRTGSPRDEEPEPDPEGASRRTVGIAAAQRLGIGPGLQLDRRLVAADEVRRHRGPLQVVEPERLRPIRLRQPGVRVGPLLAGERLAAVRERVSSGPGLRHRWSPWSALYAGREQRHRQRTAI